ncbi:MAG: hypothetical protein AAFX85_07835, partial [Pseudomonadota bacterium]
MGDLHYEWAPLRVFLVWHPAYTPGEKLFKRLHSWLGGGGAGLHRRGLGVPVQAWTSGNPEKPPRQVPLNQDFTLIVALLDGELLGRVEWRKWFKRNEQHRKRAARADLSLVVLPW